MDTCAHLFLLKPHVTSGRPRYARIKQEQEGAQPSLAQNVHVTAESPFKHT